MSVWRIAIDTGGTFTDAIGIAPDGSWRRVKVPSDGSIRALASAAIGGNEVSLEVPAWVPRPERFLAAAHLVAGDGWRTKLMTRSAPDQRRTPRVLGTLESPAPTWWRDAPVRIETGLDAPLVATLAIVGVCPGEPLPPVDLRLATTRGTNAMLEHRGARVGLLTSAGFADLLAIGDQSRPDLFAIDIVKPAPLAVACEALSERRLADGRVRLAPCREDVLQAAERLRAAGATAIAVALLPSAVWPEHARLVAHWLRAAGVEEVVASNEICSSPRYLTRAETAVAHATVAAPIRAFLADVARVVPPTSTWMLTSAGGLQRADRFVARDSFLSGPAGGVAGIAEVARRTGTAQVLGLDMGGTSADVARFGGEMAYRFETRVGPARVAAPSLAIETVAAGGGSICSVVRGELRVGPESAGASPGPACYGLGGPLTLTDVQLLLGRIDPARATLPLSSDAARTAAAATLNDARAQGLDLAPEALLHAFVAIADERMAAAIAALTVREGIDPREYALVPFGGAGGLHACGLADRLGITTILLPVDAGLLSARGLLAATVERIERRSILEPLARCAAALDQRMRELQEAARRLVRDEVGPDARIVDGPASASIKLAGQDRGLEVPFGDAERLRRGFRERFERLFGYPPPARELEVEALAAIARAETPPVVEARTEGGDAAHGARVGSTPVIERRSCPCGADVEGPALLVDLGSSAWIEAGWRATWLPTGDVRVTRRAPSDIAGAPRDGAADLELFTCRFESTATSRGEALQRTALSTNVKERLDYSCAVLDAEGMLVVNAPHLPVHLGAIGACVRSVAACLALGPGDVAITNHPAFGGSHLPDVTLITPVFHESRLVGYVANRAHHAEIGGTRPGSFPPAAASLAEEGVVIPPVLVVAGGEPRLDRLEALLTSAPYPSRAVAENLADVEAAIAANALGARELSALAVRYGGDGLASRFARLLERGEVVASEALRRLGKVERVALERLDDGAPIAVRVVPPGAAGRRPRIDFTGSAPTRSDSFNAPLSVVRAATLYALRLLVQESIPLNEGLLRAVEIVAPEGMLHPRFDADPRRCPPVVAGNTETSQRVTDALLRAFGVVAGSQGTMNNLLFGNDRFGAYETICGGAGASAHRCGADAVHTHMTNTRITDPEVFERRAPVLIREFAIRRGSGGAGRRRGGDGTVREIEFLESVQVSILAQHRVERPYGLEGGEPGACGRQWRVGLDGTRVPLPGVIAVDLTAGEAIRIETPGGGGFGSA